MYSVYRFKFPDGKLYFGLTSTNPKYRWGNGSMYNKLIRAASKDCGWDNVEKSIVASDLTKQEADELEIKLISEFHTQDPAFGYNITRGGSGVCGYKFTEEHKKHLSEYASNRPLSHRMRISESMKGRTPHKTTIEAANRAWKGQHHTEETRKKISEANRNRSEETKKKISEARKGRPVSEETRKKIGDAQRGVPKPDWLKQRFSEGQRRRDKSTYEIGARKRSTPVVCLSSKKIYMTLHDASVSEHVNEQCIASSCNSNKSTKGKFFLKYPRGTSITYLLDIFPDFELGVHI